MGISIPRWNFDWLFGEGKGERGQQIKRSVGYCAIRFACFVLFICESFLCLVLVCVLAMFSAAIYSAAIFATEHLCALSRAWPRSPGLLFVGVSEVGGGRIC